ncbi:MAG: 50S ribosome-binding GTPase [Nitrospinae bacterium]|nr:50S ribosome-binding GTPase [Nitrospinota bacterium]
MPANLTPQYLEADRRFRQAKTPAEKIDALEDMLALIPKHKGTEKMQADLKRRLSKAREEAQKKGKSGARSYGYHVPREGAGQVVLVGPPNSGKSALLAMLTNAEPEVADYPFTTRKPLPGMVEFENIQIQLVDLPPLLPDWTEGWVFALIRTADLALVLVDLASDTCLEQVEHVKAQLATHKIRLAGHRYAGELAAGEAAIPTLLVGNKADGEGAEERAAMLEELYAPEFPVLAMSAATGSHLEALRRALYDGLGILRVYTKAPGKRADSQTPFVLKKGSTVGDVAASVHKDFAAALKFAKIWGGDKYDGQRVTRDYVVQDGDVIELHM